MIPKNNHIYVRASIGIHLVSHKALIITEMPSQVTKFLGAFQLFLISLT